MLTQSSLPSYVEALRDEENGRPFGPMLGQVMSTFMDPDKYGDADYLSLLYDVLTTPCNVMIPDGVAQNIPYQARFIPGHVGYRTVESGPSWRREPLTDERPTYGPRPGCAELMVVGKHPGFTELDTEWLCSGETGRELRRCLAEQKITHFLDDAYFTNVCRFCPPKGRNMVASWVKECRWLLWAEIAIIRPKMILLLGTEAIKWFHGPKGTVTRYRGAVKPWETQVGAEVLEFDTFGTMHPAAVSRENSMRAGLASDLANVSNILRGTIKRELPRFYDEAGPHIRTVSDLKMFVDTMINEGIIEFAIDCEWAGRSPQSNGKLLTVQFSWGEGYAILLVLNRHPRVSMPDDCHFIAAHPGLVSLPAPSPSEILAYGIEGDNWPPGRVRGFVHVDERGKIDSTTGVEVLDMVVPNFTLTEMEFVKAQLKRLLERPEVRVGGHSFRADYPWLKIKLGLDLQEQYRLGFDTINSHHMLYESGAQGLTDLTLKYTDMGRYDFDVSMWADALKISKNEGYGAIPEHALYHYALCDADVTFRIKNRIDDEFHDDNNGEDHACLTKLVQTELNASVAILEMEAVGLEVDVKRVHQLAKKYAGKRDEMLDELRRQLNWDVFNFRSVQHVKELLFGEEFNGKKRIDPDRPIRIRPADAPCCHLTPIKTTGKPARAWETITGREAEHSPSTDKETLGILGAQDDIANQVRCLRFLNQMINSFTGKPRYDPVEGDYTDGGLLQYLDPDNRVRTHILQITETARWTSTGPNLQNLPKRREGDLEQMFAEGDRPHRVRSIFRAKPGYLLVEADYCVAAGTRVATGRGLIPIEEICSGSDLAVQEDGSVRRITALLPRGERDTVVVRLDGGMELVCTPEHRVRVIDRAGDYVWREVSQLLITDFVAINGASIPHDVRSWELPSVRAAVHHNEKPVSVPDSMSPEFAEFLGYLVGDGSWDDKYLRFVINEADTDVAAVVERGFRKFFSRTPSVSRYRGVIEFKVGSKRLCAWLRVIDLSKEHVPFWLWRESPDVILAFIRGYFEADGCVSGGHVTVTSSRETIIRDVQGLLLASCGIAADYSSGLNGKNRAFIAHKLRVSSSFSDEFSKSCSFIGARKRACLRDSGGCNHNGKRACLPNQRDKAVAFSLDNRGSCAAKLLANTRNLDRNLSSRAAAKLREIASDSALGIELFRVLDHKQDFRRVVSVSPGGIRQTYDLTVDDTHTYVSDGFVSHNCQAELMVLALLSGDPNFLAVLSEVLHYPCLVSAETGKPYRWLHPDWIRNVECKLGERVPHGSFVGEFREADGNWTPLTTGIDTVVKEMKWGRDLHAERAISGFHLPYCPVLHGPPKKFVESTAKDKRVAAKCIDPDTVVFSGCGPVIARELFDCGKSVWDGERQIACKAVTRYESERVTVVTRRGAVRCTLDHRFQLADGSLREARDLKPGTLLPLPALASGFDSLTAREVKLNPFQKRIGDGPCRMTLGVDWAYFAGLIQGDGSRLCSYSAGSMQYMISHGHGDEYADWRQEIILAGERLGISMVPSGTKGRPDRVRCGSKVVGRFLDGLGLGGDSGRILRVPWWVLRGGREVALAYLAGLFDTDGTVAKIDAKSASSNICTKDPIFAGQLTCLLNALGEYGSISLSWNKKYERYYYKVGFPNTFLSRYANAFPLRRSWKVERWRHHCARIAVKTLNRTPKDNVVLIVLPDEVGEVLDVEVDSPSHIYVQGGLLGHNTVNFGIPYGRSAPAIARELRQEGVIVEDEETQGMIDGFFVDFPLVFRFLNSCRALVESHGYMRNAFGRYRRFADPSDKEKRAGQEREASNFPIQSVVAECLNAAAWNVWSMRDQMRRMGYPLQFTINLGIHDALLFEVPVDEIALLMPDGGLIDRAMSDDARIPLPDPMWCGGLYNCVNEDLFPFALGVDKGMMLRWDEKPDKQVLQDMGVPLGML